jgi:hypothetical protein
MANQNKVGTTATAVQRTADGILRVIYHSTAVVEVTPAGLRLESGGWRTATTKTRMNQASNQYALGFKVFARARAWYVSYRGEELPFVDGLILAHAGQTVEASINGRAI